MLTGDREGYLTLFLESGNGLIKSGHIQANGIDIVANYNSSPFVVDWNDDGKKDLVVGEESSTPPDTGNIRVYLNHGTNSAPVFGNYSPVWAGAGQLYRYRINPVVYDLDTDGLKDLIIGNDDGRVYFYKNVGTTGAPAFNATFDTLMTDEGNPIDVFAGSRIHFVDWTGDGDLDLLISGYEGYVQVCENTTGTAIQEGQQTITTVTGPVITPNPLTSSARFSFSLSASSHVRIEIYSVDGRLVGTPLDEHRAHGRHEFSWDATDNRGRKLPSGIYIARLTTDSETKTTSVVITR